MRVRPPTPARASYLRNAGEFFRGLRPFFSQSLTVDEARRTLAQRLSEREASFATVLQRAVFEHAASPYRRLFEWAHIGLGDVISMLATDGVDRTLERLHDAGVYISLEEFKGRCSLRRGGLELDVRAEDFDNPIAARRYEASTGGSMGTSRPVFLDLDLIAHESAYHAAFYDDARLADRPFAVWHLVPPGSVALKLALTHAKLRRPNMERWFTPVHVRETALKHAMFTRATLLTSALCGARIPAPEYVSPSDAIRVAFWLAAHRDQGTPAILSTTPSAAVRTCAAALDQSLDIAGSVFVLVGEPYTSAKAGIVAAAGCRALSHYGMTEAGLLGIACLAPSAIDDVHVLEDKIAVVQRRCTVSTGAATVDALFLTTLLTASPKIMLNVETGDHGVLTSRACECGCLTPGFTRRLHTIRSYEKLTSEGMHFLGGDILSLVEHVLPAAFGGRATDYQFLEREERGLPKVSIVVRPDVGNIDDGRLVTTVLDFLRHRSAGHRLMAGVWVNGETLGVVRGDPYVTAGGKIPALRTLSD